MQNNIIILVILYVVLISCDYVHSATTIINNEISWEFGADYTTGQFITGDYYVVDSGSGVVLNQISPSASIVDGKDWNGSMVNPDPGYNHGYDGRLSGYLSALNKAKSLPLTLYAGDVLISSVTSDSEYMTGTSDMSVLTVLSSVPPAGSFRPGYCDLGRTIFNESQLNYSKLQNLAAPSGAPSLSTLVPNHQRPWVSHGYGSTGVWMHPGNNMPPYGGNIAKSVGTTTLALNLNNTNEDKRSLLIGMVQVGIDFYSVYKRAMEINPSYVGTRPPANIWSNDGGNTQGHKWPILFAGIMLNDSNMKSIGLKTGDYILNGVQNIDGTAAGPSDYFYFSEDDQTFYVTQYDVDITHSQYWLPDDRTAPNYPYTSVMLGMPEWGIRHATEPNQSDSSWNANYRNNNTGATFTGFILAARIMGAKVLWNHNVLFDYVDRFEAIGNGSSDPFGYTVPDEYSGWANDGFVGAMYSTYKNYKPGQRYKNVKSITQDQP